MYTVLIFIALIICVSLCGWAIAELKSKDYAYRRSAEETEVEQHAAESVSKDGFHELGINDVIKTISTKGFEA